MGRLLFHFNAVLQLTRPALSRPYHTPSGRAFAVTTGNVLGTITVTGDGWSATITNTNLATPLHTCGIYIGSTSVAPASKKGEPKCN